MRRRITIGIIIIILLLIFFACVFIPRDNTTPVESETPTNTPTTLAEGQSVDDTGQTGEQTEESAAIPTETATQTATATNTATPAPEIYDPANYNSEELWRIISDTLVDGYICPQLAGCNPIVTFEQGELIRVVENEDGILTIVTLEDEVVYISEEDAELVESFDEPETSLEDTALTQRALAASGATETAVVRQGFATETAVVRQELLTETAAARQLEATQTTAANQSQNPGGNTTGGSSTGGNTTGNTTGSTTGGGTSGNNTTGSGTGSTTGGGSTSGNTVIFLPGRAPNSGSGSGSNTNPTAVPTITPDPNYTPEAYGDYPPGVDIRPTPTSPGPDGGLPTGIITDPGLGVPPPDPSNPPY